MFRKLHILCLCLLAVVWLPTGSLSGQGVEPQKQILPASELQWKFVQSAHFRVHYYTLDAALGELTIKLAEEALHDLAKQLDYRPRGHYALHLFLSPDDLIHSNQFPEDEFKEPGVTPLKSNSSYVIYPGSTPELRKKVTAAVARLLLEEFYFAGSISSSIQRSVLLHVPEWYLEGFSAYLGEGWDFEDEVRIAGLHGEDLMQYAIEGTDAINRTVRKSLWYYVAQEYGDDKLAEIFYMTRVTRSVEVAFVKVWGIQLKTLTERWREFTNKRIAENHQYRDELDKKTTKLELNPKDRLMGFALNPQMPVAAVYLIRDGLQRIALADLITGEITETGMEGGFKTDQYLSFEQEIPMAWSDNGQYLLSVIYKDNLEQVAYYDRATGNFNFQTVRPQLERVLSLGFSHDGTEAICSGLAGGNINIYTFKPGTTRFRAVTQTTYDHLYPVFSQDDRSILFASNQAEVAEGEEEKEANSYRRARNHLDLYRIERDNPEGAPVRITDTPEDNETWAQPVSSFEVMFITDETGIPNLKKQNIFTGQSAIMSNLTRGMLGVNMNDSLVLMATSLKGQPALHYATPEAFMREFPTLPETRLKYLKHKYFEKAEETRRRVEEEKARILQEIKEEAIRQAKEDSTEAEEAEETNTPRFYVFDEGTEKPAKVTKKKLFKTRKLTRFSERELIPDFDTLAIKRPARSKTEWSSDYVETTFGFDPIWRLYMDLGLGFTDIKKNHRMDLEFRPYWNLRTSDMKASYQYLKPKTDLGVSVEKNSRFLNDENFLLRYNSYTLDLSANYPLSRFSGVRVNTDHSFIRRWDLDPTDEQDLDESDIVSRAGAFYTYNRTRTSQGYTRSGFRFDGGVSTAWSHKNGNLSFTTAQFDARNYLPVKSNIVFATRLSGAMSLGNRAQQYYMGGTPDWLFGGFQNPQELPLDQEISAYRYMEYVTPVRGFLFNGRNGTKYVVANAELRIPISRSISSSLNSNPLYNVEIIPFYDIGTIWRTGNPLSQKNPINTLTIDQYPLLIDVQTLKSPFIMGFGTGVRTMLMGYNVRFDMAWGVEDNTVLKPKLHLSLGKNF